MDEKSVVASLALHAVLEPIFQEVSSLRGSAWISCPIMALLAKIWDGRANYEPKYTDGILLLLFITA